jgi:hypothetical protein
MRKRRIATKRAVLIGCKQEVVNFRPDWEVDSSGVSVIRTFARPDWAIDELEAAERERLSRWLSNDCQLLTGLVRRYCVNLHVLLASVSSGRRRHAEILMHNLLPF